MGYVQDWELPLIVLVCLFSLPKRLSGGFFVKLSPLYLLTNYFVKLLIVPVCSLNAHLVLSIDLYFAILLCDLRHFFDIELYSECYSSYISFNLHTFA